MASWPSCPSGLARPSLDPVLAHLAGQGVAVHAERVGRLGQAAVALLEDARDEALLELANGVLELDAACRPFLRPAARGGR